MEPRLGAYGKFHGFDITIKGAAAVDWDDRHSNEIERAGGWAAEDDEAGIVHVTACTKYIRDARPVWKFEVNRSTIQLEAASDIANSTIVHTGDSDVIRVLHTLNKVVTAEIAEYGGRVVRAFFENRNKDFETPYEIIVYDHNEDKWENVHKNVASFIRVTKALATARCELHDAPKHAPRLQQLPDTVIDTIINSMTGL
jgi:hypothetical protein